MANPEHLDILGRGVTAWNKWRSDNPAVIPSLAGAMLVAERLNKIDLRGADLRNANLWEANLCQADLSQADLTRANLQNVYFYEANLSGVNLSDASLRSAKLRGANLSSADLSLADFTWASLMDANFTNSRMILTYLIQIDLSEVKGLDTVDHLGPSFIGIDTIYRSQGMIPEIFLRGVGAPEPFIANMKALVAAMSPIEFYSCFISYSSKDQEFAQRLHADLQANGVHCWFAPEDLKIGDKLRPSFDEAIRIHDKLMVILSESSVQSSWVEKEVETAFEKERQQNRTVLFPIRLDDAVMETKQAWAADIRRTRHIGDFRGWRDHDSFKKAFERLLRDLKSETRTRPAAQNG